MSDKKHILIFSHNYYPNMSGAEIAIQELTKRLKGYSFTMITAWRDQSLPRVEKIGVIKLLRVGTGRGSKLDQHLYPFIAPFKALKLHKQNHFACSWAMMPSQAGMAALFFKYFQWLGSFFRSVPYSGSGSPPDQRADSDARPLRQGTSLGDTPSPNKALSDAAWRTTPYLLTDQSGDSEFFWYSRTFFWRPLFRQVFKRATRMQVISSYLRDKAREMGYKGEITLIPNGVDLERFGRPANKALAKALRKEHGIGMQEVVLFTTSRLVVKNAIEVVISAIAKLTLENEGKPANERASHKFVVFGDGDYRENLKQIVRMLKVGDRVIFLGDMDNDLVPRYLSLADIFVRPSRSEGQGISFIEAMAAGVPIIATPVGGIPDFLTDHETGLFCKVDDAADLASKIKLIMSNRELRSRVIENARKLVRERYNWNHLAHDMEQLFDEMTSKYAG